MVRNDPLQSPWVVTLKGKGHSPMNFILWLIAVILVVAGVVALTRRQVVYGIVLIIVGLLVGPGGVSVFTTATPWLTG